MTPKEKAFELSMKFENLGETDNAKQCAKIAVDEIIENNRIILDGIKYHEQLNYWQEVIQEIEKL